MDLLNLFDFELAAKDFLSTPAYDYYAGGAADEKTLKESCDAFDRIKLRPRVMVDVHSRSLATTVLGQSMSMPVMIAPMAFQALAHADGEYATARAASSAGIPMLLSSLSTVSMEEVVDSTTAAVWFQLYIFRDRGLTRALVQRAENAGCRALVVTVDAPLQGKRERDIRNRFQLPAGVQMKNLLPVDKADFPHVHAGSGLAAFINSQFDPSLTWRDIEWLRSQTTLPVVVKGILRGDDAAQAVASGAHGVIVSNHGGRQLDTAIASIDALREVVDRVSGAGDVMLDGGIRRGTDVIKALAYGARAVLLGRPVLWGLAIDGEAGVSRVIELLREEIDIAMGLCGCVSPGDVTRDLAT